MHPASSVATSVAWIGAITLAVAAGCSSSSSSSGGGAGPDGGGSDAPADTSTVDTGSAADSSPGDASGDSPADAPRDSGAASDGDGGTASCVGGIIIDGSCEARCQPSLCVTGNTCVGNRCELVCQSVRDCRPGQACVPATEDGTGKAIAICTSDGKSAGIGTPCPLGTECATLFACPDGTACGASLCSGQTCTAGRCPDGSACTPATCAASECTALTCFGKGPGDANAYCSTNDCTADADCSQGMGCEIRRDPHAVCPATTASSLCGTTTDPCIDPSSFSANGATYFQGSVCLLRKSCLTRVWCDACATDADCSLVPGQHCKTVGPDMRCVVDCATDTDCIAGLHCAGGSCVPRFSGGCVGQGNFCEPCTNDQDCGPAGTSKACVQFDTGERACLDLSFPDPCMVDADCPTAPSGRHGLCQNAAAGFSSGQPGYDHCFAPYDPTTYTYGCW